MSLEVLLTVSFISASNRYHARIQRGMWGARGSGPPPPLKNHKAIGFLIDTDPDPIENHKATKPVFNVGPPSARHLNL